MVNSKSLSNLRPFRRGQSGNPGGLPKGKPKISAALLRFMVMPVEVFLAFEPRTVAEELAKTLMEIALGDNANAALLAIKEIADRTEGKPGRAIYLHQGNGEITITYDKWQPPQLELEPGDAFDSERGVLIPASTEENESTAVA
jgi:hypothetical protein